jgi:cobyrinic acid a,c-diamide synthase
VKTCDGTFLGPAGTVLRGHEFHWSSEKSTAEQSPLYLTRTASQTEYSIKCGYFDNNICASYIHLHWASHPQTAKFFAETIASTKIS